MWKTELLCLLVNVLFTYQNKTYVHTHTQRKWNLLDYKNRPEVKLAIIQSSYTCSAFYAEFQTSNLAAVSRVIQM